MNLFPLLFSILKLASNLTVQLFVPELTTEVFWIMMFEIVHWEKERIGREREIIAVNSKARRHVFICYELIGLKINYLFHRTDY
jgi:hypothetical protein